MKRILTYWTIILATLQISGCKPLDLEPVDNWTLNNYWKTEEQTERFLRGLHYRLQRRMETFVLLGALRGGTMS